MDSIFSLIVLFAFGFFLYKYGKRKEEKQKEWYMNTIHRELINDDDDKQPASQVYDDANSQPMHFDMLDDNGEPVKPVTSGSPAGEIKVVIGGGNSDAPVQELQYFCIKDKGYHVSVWPKDQRIGEYMEFPIAGLKNVNDIDKYIGEFVSTLEPEPTNSYDANAIKILAPDGHHVGYVPRDQTQFVREFTTLPCQCFCYIGINDDTYFSCCYITSKNL